MLNLADEPEVGVGSVIIFDLTKSTLLFEEFSPSFALKQLNNYFERLGQVAFQAGAVLDNYMGDGALLRFNVHRPQPDHEFDAVKAALAMRKEFEDLRGYWIDLAPRLEAIWFRAGISSGPLFWGNLGHSLSQRLTIVGPPISVAAALCNEAERDRSIILLSGQSHKAVADRVIGQSRDLKELGKIEKFTDSVYEIEGLRGL